MITRLWSEAERGLAQPAITELVRFNEAIDQAIAESVAFHSMEVERWRDTLLAVIGHDLRGPLGALMMTAEALSNTTSDPMSVRFIGIITRSIERLSNLLNSLLDRQFSRMWP